MKFHDSVPIIQKKEKKWCVLMVNEWCVSCPAFQRQCSVASCEFDLAVCNECETLKKRVEAAKMRRNIFLFSCLNRLLVIQTMLTIT